MGRAWKPLLTGLAGILGVACYAVASDVYKTVDAQGHVTYSDHALSPESKKVTLDVIQANPQEAARMAKQLAAENADAVQRAKSAREQGDEQQRQKAQQQEQQQRCQAARDRYATFASGGRLFHIDAQGERVYYTDEEIQAQASTAKAAMDSACAP
jgi:predicted anti-sigma-YlaC factor YlaD